MEIIANMLLAAGAFGAAAYCRILSWRLRKFTALEGGMGGAIAVLSAQVDEMSRALEAARLTAGGSAQHLQALTGRAEGVAVRLELLVAAMHDLPVGRSADAAGADMMPVAGRRLRLVRRNPRAPAFPEAVE